MASKVRFDEILSGANDGEYNDEIYSPESLNQGDRGYTPFYERTDMTTEEKLMWDQLVKEEMDKLESEFQEQALLGASVADKQMNTADMSKLQYPLFKHHQGQTNNHHIPAREIETKLLINAPVTVISAQKTKAPSQELAYVPNTILSGIGASARRNARQKLTKRQEFMQLVAEDEEKRKTARELSELLNKDRLKHTLSKEDRELQIDAMVSDSDYSYSSRWDNIGAQNLAEGSPRTMAAQKKKQMQMQYAELLRQQQQEKQAAQARINETSSNFSSMSIALPAEQDSQLSPINGGRSRHVSRFSARDGSDFEGKRQKQLKYHEQLAGQIAAAKKELDDSQPKSRKVMTAPPSDTISGSTGSVGATQSLLDTIGTVNYQKQDAELKRQIQQQYHTELALAASSQPLSTERVSLRDKYSRIAASRDDCSTSINIGDDVPFDPLEAKTQALNAKRRQQHEYRLQLMEASSQAPIKSPRAALRAHRVNVPANQPTEAFSQQNEGNSGNLLANGLQSMGPVTSFALKRAQQEQYRQHLAQDKAHHSTVAMQEDDRVALKQYAPQPPAPTGLIVGPNIGTSTRQTLNHRRQEEYAHELEMDRVQPPIPSSYVPRPKIPSACSPRPGQDDNGYFNTGTSIQIGASVATNEVREREKKILYQRMLNEDFNNTGRVEARLSPRRPPRSDVDASQMSIRLENIHDVDTAAAIAQRQRDRAIYVAMLEESRNYQPIPQDRVPLLQLQQDSASFLLPGPAPRMPFPNTEQHDAQQRIGRMKRSNASQIDYMNAYKNAV